jgi:hypothetical protein
MRVCGSHCTAFQRLGTRAVVAETLVAEAEKVDRAVRNLVTAAADGDIAAAKALIPWLNQALGMPRERVEQRTPGSFEELEQMDTAQLEQLVAAGRRGAWRLSPRRLVSPSCSPKDAARRAREARPGAAESRGSLVRSL